MEKYTEDELKAKLLEQWNEIYVDEIRKCISVCKKNVYMQYTNIMEVTSTVYATEFASRAC